MHEDKEEILMKLFPKGFIITYIQENNEPAYHWFNPNNDEFIGEYLDMMDYLFGDEDEITN